MKSFIPLIISEKDFKSKPIDTQITIWENLDSALEDYVRQLKNKPLKTSTEIGGTDGVKQFADYINEKLKNLNDIFNKEVMVNYAFNIVINLSIIIYVLKQKKSKNNKESPKKTPKENIEEITKETLKENHGVEYPIQNKKIYLKMKQTILERKK